MEPLTVETVFGRDFFVRFLVSVDLVSDNRVPDSRHMDADLVSTSGEELDFEERVFVVNMFKECEFRPSELGIHRILGGHLFSVVWVSSDKGFDHTLLVFYESENDSVIEFLYFSIRHFLLEFTHRTVVFGNEDESARIFVQSMDDSWTFHTVDDREISEMMEECIYERSGISEFSGNRMGIHSRILTYDCKIRVIENNLEIHIFRLKVRFFGLEFYFENISFLYSFVALKYFSIDLKTSFFYELLHIGTRMLRKKGR